MSKPVYLEITPFFPTPEHFVGPYIYDQVKAIEKNSDYRVVVIKVVPFFSQEPSSYTYQGVKVFNFKVLDLPSSILPGLFHTINLQRIERFLEKIVQIDLDNIAILHGHVAYPAGALAVDLGKRRGIKNFVQHHGLDVMQLRNGRVLKGKLRQFNNVFIKKRFLKTVNRTDLNIGVSNKVLDELQNIRGFENQNTYVLYNGVDPAKFHKIENFRKKEGYFTIGCIGNFWKIKDQMTLLKALDILINQKGIKTIQTVFVGSGRYLEACRHFVETHGLTSFVEFRKEIDHTRLNRFYNSLDLFVLPSYYEALGCVYTEALQVDVPVIAVEGQGIEELIYEDQKPLSLIPKGDFRKLAKRIEHHIQNGPIETKYDLSIDRFIGNFLLYIEKTANV